MERRVSVYRDEIKGPGIYDPLTKEFTPCNINNLLNYVLNLEPKPEIIFIGSNLGYSTYRQLSEFFAANQITVEPD